VGEKTASVGHFQIPTAPAALTAVAQSASANTLGSAVSFGNAPSALFITGVTIGVATTQTPTYVQIQILVAAGIVGSVLVPYGVSSAAASTVVTGYRAIYPPIPVANGAAITVKSASSVASAVSWGVSLECIAQASVVDDGVAVATVTTVTNQLTAAQIATGVWQDTTAGDFTVAASVGKSVMNGVSLGTGLTVASVSGAVGSVTGLTASNLDTTISSRMASYTQPTGFLAATFPATVASTTNITAGTITTVTNLTNAPTAGDLTATMKTSVTTAATAATPTAAAVTGAVGSVTGNVGGNVVGSVASVTAAVTLPTIPANWITAAGINAAALNGKGDWNIGKTGYALTQTFPSNFSTLAISAGGLASTDIKAVNGITVNGAGTAGSPWGP
jgi:hypothetical protein